MRSAWSGGSRRSVIPGDQVDTDVGAGREFEQLALHTLEQVVDLDRHDRRRQQLVAVLEARRLHEAGELHSSCPVISMIAASASLYSPVEMPVSAKMRIRR